MINSPEPSTQVHSPDELGTTVERLTRQNDELRRANAILSRSNQDLERFAFAAGHDLQEPLRAITAYAELLAQKCRTELDKDAEMCVTNIVEGGARMRALLADLLAYAEIGAVSDGSGEMVDLNLVLEKAKQNLKLAIGENGASVESGDLPTLSATCEVHFVQLFQNLVGNAIKYRSEAKPVIKVSVRDMDGKPEFGVADNGLGVAPENHRKIFQAFIRLHDNRSPGTGIGLAICQRVVERYGGRIWIDSQLGHGATFRFTLPNLEVRPKTLRMLAASPASAARIVLVDDNPADVTLLRLAFQRAELDCDLTVITDGAEAVAFVRQHDQDARSPIPDLAVLDMNLPKSDGMEILKAMRENRTLTNVPVAILSSGLSPRDRATIQEFKRTHYFPKPSTLEEFLAIGLRLKAVLEHNPVGQASGALA